MSKILTYDFYFRRTDIEEISVIYQESARLKLVSEEYILRLPNYQNFTIQLCEHQI